MRGLAEGFSAGFNMAESYKTNKFNREMKTKQEGRDAETHGTSQESARLKNEADGRANRLNTEYDGAIGAGQPGLAAPTAARVGDAGDYGDGGQFGSIGQSTPGQAVTNTARIDPQVLNDAALRAGKISPDQHQQAQRTIRAEKFNKIMGQRVGQFMQDDDALKGVLGNFSKDDSTFGQAHWVAGGEPGRPGDPNPKTGKGGYAYVMVGDREPFKLNRAESARLASAYQIMQEDPENYELAFATLDSGTKKMRELGAAFRAEFALGVKQNNEATHMANVDGNSRATLGLAQDRAARDKFGTPMQMIGPDGTPALMQPVMGREGASYQQVQMPQGYRLPKQVDPAVLDRMASNMVGQPSGEMVNGKAVPHTYESAYEAAHARLSGQRSQGASPDIAGDAAAARAMLGQQAPAQARPQAGLAPQARPSNPPQDRLRQMMTGPQSQGGPTRGGQEQIIGPDGRVYFRPVDDGVDPQARLLGIMR